MMYIVCYTCRNSIIEFGLAFKKKNLFNFIFLRRKKLFNLFVDILQLLGTIVFIHFQQIKNGQNILNFFKVKLKKNIYIYIYIYICFFLRDYHTYIIIY